MSDTAIEDVTDEKPKKKSKALLFGLVGAVVLGGVSFYGVYSGMIPLPFGEEKPEMAAHGADGKDSRHGDENAQDGAAAHVSDPSFTPGAFVAMEPMVISLSEQANARHLRLILSIEVEPGQEETVASVTPRINDVLNTFLRAVDEGDIESPRAMVRLRAQMLRRVQLVTPKGAVRDVLIQEFVLN